MIHLDDLTTPTKSVRSIMRVRVHVFKCFSITEATLKRHASVKARNREKYLGGL